MSIGVFYVATGEAYGHMAKASINSLKDIESCPITVYCDREVKNILCAINGIDLIEIPKPRYNWNDKIYGFMNTPYDKSIYLDSDVLAIRPFVEDFSEGLDYVDIMARSEGVSFNYDWETEKYPVTIPQFSTGVVAFRKDALKSAFDRWNDLCEIYGGVDQPTFRAAMIESRITVSEMSAGFHCAGNGNLSEEIRLLHAFQHKRLLSNPRKVRKLIENARSFSPPGLMSKNILLYSGKKAILSNFIYLFAIEFFWHLNMKRKSIKRRLGLYRK